MRATFVPEPLTYFVGNANGRGLIRIETDSTARVAGVHVASLTRNMEPYAQLFHAAPDLLAALSALREVAAKNVVSGIELDAADAAIAKARGGA